GMADVYSQGMISVLDDLRRRKVLTDAEVLCTEDGARFSVHRALLHAACPLFRESPSALAAGVTAVAAAEDATSSPCAAYPVDNIRGPIMAALLQFVYTNKVALSSENVLDMLLAAQRFQVRCGRTLVKDLGLWSESAESDKVLCWAFCSFLLNFSLRSLNRTERSQLVSKMCQEFVRISFDDLKALLSSDELNLADEGKAFSAVIKWTEADVATRHRFLPSLLSAIRFGLCKVSFLQEEVFSHPLLDDVDCRAALEPVHGLLDQLELHEGPQNGRPMASKHAPTCSFFRDVLFVIGGWSNGSATNLVESYDCRANRWLIFPNDRDIMPRAYHGLVALDGLIYMIGGFDGSQCFNCVRCFNPVFPSRWTERACMHVARCYVSVAVLEGKIYALGGYDGDRRTNTAERYDPVINTWTLIAEMNDQRSDACATVVDNKVYIVGGFTGQQVLNTAEFYDPKVNVWTYIRAMTVPRSGVRVINYQDTVYVLGGFNGTNRLSTGRSAGHGTQSTCLFASHELKKRRMGRPHKKKRPPVKPFHPGTTTVPFVECYDAKLNSWRRVTDMNINRSALGACVAINLPNSKEF
ncbi:ring canal protein, putative, partial [Ixodes scapularis]